MCIWDQIIQYTKIILQDDLGIQAFIGYSFKSCFQDNFIDVQQACFDI